jgi:hypothetical protein
MEIKNDAKIFNIGAQLIRASREGLLTPYWDKCKIVSATTGILMALNKKHGRNNGRDRDVPIRL